MLDQVTMAALRQIAHGVAAQFGNGCEVVIHDLNHPDHSIVYIENGHVSDREVGGGPSFIILDALKQNPETLEDKLGFLTKLHDGRILKSSTIFIRDDTGTPSAAFSINFDVTELLALDAKLQAFTSTDKDNEGKSGHVNGIPLNVNGLLDELIAQSIKLVGKPVALMSKDDKIKAIQFLNDAGAFLISKSGNRVTKEFCISKYTLYSYIDAGKAS